MLDIKGLTKTYPTGDRALQGVDMHIERGELVALIGPSGAGKSTLLRCINRLVSPGSGAVLLDGVDLSQLRGGRLRKARTKIGMIFQEYALVERLTVLENVLSGKLGTMSLRESLLRRYRSRDVRRALDLLAEVGLEDQYEKRADALSGGQRQRVGIARALMQDPSLLLVDEPTASLDPKTARRIMRLVQSACADRNLPAIVNLHDVQLAQLFAHRIVGLKEGRVVFDGPPVDLSDDMLTLIYGEEDWQATVKKRRTSTDKAMPNEDNPSSVHSLEERIDV